MTKKEFKDFIESCGLILSDGRFKRGYYQDSMVCFLKDNGEIQTFNPTSPILGYKGLDLDIIREKINYYIEYRRNEKIKKKMNLIKKMTR